METKIIKARLQIFGTIDGRYEIVIILQVIPQYSRINNTTLLTCVCTCTVY